MNHVDIVTGLTLLAILVGSILWSDEHFLISITFLLMPLSIQAIGLTALRKQDHEM